MRSGSGLSDLLPRIYDAAIAPQEWPRVLSEIAGLFSASYSGLTLGDPPSRLEQIGSCGSDPEYLRSYGEHFARIDPVVPMVVRSPVGTILSDAMVMPRAAMDRNEFFQDWVRPQGLYSVLVANLLRQERTVGVTIISRSRQEEEFREADLDLLSIILPHLQRAVQVQLRLDAARVEQNIAMDALDRLPHGILIADQECRVLLANRAAERILAETDGLGAGRSGLYAATAAQTNRLRCLVTRAAPANPRQGIGGALLIDRPSMRQPFQVLVSPLHAGCAGTEKLSKASGALIVIIDPERQPNDLETRLRSLFSLTRTEARVARGVAAGEGLAAVAESLGIFSSTARTHLHRIFEKTDTQRQAELAKIVERLATLSADEG